LPETSKPQKPSALHVRLDAALADLVGQDAARLRLLALLERFAREAERVAS